MVEKDKEIEELKKENKILKEYIFKAPNLDEMTAVKYVKIQEEAYIRGRAEEQQRARKIICENYIPISAIQNKIKEIDKKEKEELKGLKGQDRYFVKQMYQYMRKPLDEILEKGNK